MGIILVDLDEVLFPFAHTYAGYRERKGLPSISTYAWDNYLIDDDHVPGHQDLMKDFFADPATLAEPPVALAVQTLTPLVQHHRLIGCTARYEATEAEATMTWVERHTPWLEDVRFVSWHRASGRVSTKAWVAMELGALALVDDTPVHLERVHLPTLGLLVERPEGVTSSPGALPWTSIAAALASLETSASA